MYTVSYTPYTKTSTHYVHTTRLIDIHYDTLVRIRWTDCNSSATPRVEVGSHIAQQRNFMPPCTSGAPRGWSRLQSWRRGGAPASFLPWGTRFLPIQILVLMLKWFGLRTGTPNKCRYCCSMRIPTMWLLRKSTCDYEISQTVRI